MRAALALLLHAGAVLSARHEFGRTCELHDLDERPTGLWRVFPDLRWLWSGSPTWSGASSLKGSPRNLMKSSGSNLKCKGFVPPPLKYLLPLR